MKRRILPLLIVMSITISPSIMAQDQIDIEGHRGSRGLLPENTIPGFIKALELGVTTLEMDVVITGDGDVILSHEPFFNKDICVDYEGNKLSGSKEELNIYKMTTEQVQSYDCGSIGNPGFPDQEKMKVSKPLLSDVIKAVENHIKAETGFLVDYNIELKSEPKGDGEFHPIPEEFSKLVYEVIDAYLPWERVIIQCFDFRVLQYWNQNYPEVRLAALVSNMKTPDKNLEELGFTPAIYSPYFKLMNADKVSQLHEKGIKVIPWTINDPDDMKKAIEWGVDGIITDYPDRSKELGLNLEIPYGN